MIWTRVLARQEANARIDNCIFRLATIFLVISTIILSTSLLPIVGAKRSEDPERDEKWIKAYVKRQKESYAEAHIDFESQLDDLSPTSNNATEAAGLVISTLVESLQDRLSAMFEKTSSAECRAKIATHFGYFVNAIGKESDLPFSNIKFLNTCPEEAHDFDNLPDGITFNDIMNRTYQPPPEEADYIAPEDLKLLYGILTHESSQSTIRLIESLYEEGHTFVIHVDGKESSEAMYMELNEYAQDKSHIHLVPHPYRVRVNWGGFSMVNATLQMLKYSFGLLDVSPSESMDFHKFVHISASSYPIKSNHEIRHRIASYPLDANLFQVVMKPITPSRKAWHYFVECDDALHRIYQLPPLKTGSHGISLYTGSQWFISSRDFAKYLAVAKEGTLVNQYLDYIEHVAVSDESFFGTILRQTEFCTTHHNSNFLHYEFDRWESEIVGSERDARKCIMPDPSKCGRSPSTLTTDYLTVMSISDALFARKFSNDPNSDVKRLIDKKRAQEEEYFKTTKEKTLVRPQVVDTSFEGLGVLIVAKDTIQSNSPLCLGLGPNDNKVKLVPCFYQKVVPTLEQEWESGAVIEDEVLPNNRWEINSCSTDGNLKRSDTGEMIVTPGLYTPAGPHCMIKQHSGHRKDRCLDIEGERAEPGGGLHVFPCATRWNQLFAFGDGDTVPSHTIHASVPTHIQETIRRKGKDLAPYLCTGAAGRGSSNYKPWVDKKNRKNMNPLHFLPESKALQQFQDGVPPLNLWIGKHLVTVPCSDLDAIIEFVFVPFIEEEEEGTNEIGTSEDDMNDSTKIDEL